ncbi:PAS domain S-box protein [Patescibacteria group bacterium]|nr:PAS domain S-box protein [Patescibacteria group bacterium]MBU1721169.1 PAS domain S-box protein [Patescibacteria group bacterium]MBU1900901.1 PAS domain S-box protein [Patescibacteria group bacterium]
MSVTKKTIKKSSIPKNKKEIETYEQISEHICSLDTYIKKNQALPLFAQTKKRNTVALASKKINIVLKQLNDIIEQKTLQEKEMTLFRQLVKFFGIFMLEGVTKKNIKELLVLLGMGIDVSRVYIFKNGVGKNNKIITSQIAEWTAKGVSSQEGASYVKDVSFLDLGLKHWINVLSSGKSIAKNKKDFSVGEKKLFTPQKIESILVVPIFIEESWWGFVGVDDCRHARNWDVNQEFMLHAAAHQFAIILERDQTKKELFEEHKRIESIVNFIPTAIFTVDKEQHILSWNKHAEEITGYSQEEVLGKSCKTFAVGPCREKCGLYNDKEIKPILNKECSIKTKTGELLWIEKNVDYLYNEQGGIVGGIESFVDITEKKKQEEIVKGKMNDLEKLNKFMIGRELKMRKLKDEVDDLTKQLLNYKKK